MHFSCLTNDQLSSEHRLGLDQSWRETLQTFLLLAPQAQSISSRSNELLLVCTGAASQNMSCNLMDWWWCSGLFSQGTPASSPVQTHAVG